MINSIYLEEFRENLGYMYQSAVYNYKYDLKEFNEIFLSSTFPSQMENGNPHYLVGFCGSELVVHSVEEVTGFAPERLYKPTLPTGTTEYWIGWIIGALICKTDFTFKQIFDKISIDDFYFRFITLHQRSEEQALNKLISLIKE